MRLLYTVESGRWEDSKCAIDTRWRDCSQNSLYRCVRIHQIVNKDISNCKYLSMLVINLKKKLITLFYLSINLSICLTVYVS